MKIKKFLIAGGNSTLLVWGCPAWKKSQVIKKYLGEVEQIGFIEESSGLDQEIKFNNKNNISYLNFSLPVNRKGNIVLFPGIGFIYSNTRKYRSKRTLSSLAQKYLLPAFGTISYQDNRLVPYVYVSNTNSLFKETACGSGSIACSIVTGYSRIIHPTGQSILVRQRGDIFIVGAKVVKIGCGYD